MKEDELLTLLNQAWALIPLKPKYNDFNSKAPFGEAIPVLEELEKSNPKLGLADFEPYPLEEGRKPFEGLLRPVEGITVLSLIATITDVLCNRRLAAEISEDGTITGWTWFIPSGGTVGE